MKIQLFHKILNHNYNFSEMLSLNLSFFVGVVFENLIEHSDTLPPHIVYKIRQNASFTDNTKFVRDKYWHPGPGDPSDKYYHFGFVWLQVSHIYHFKFIYTSEWILIWRELCFIGMNIDPKVNKIFCEWKFQFMLLWPKLWSLLIG